MTNTICHRLSPIDWLLVRRFLVATGTALCLACFVVAPSLAAEEALHQAAQLIEQLDDARFEVRQRAAAHLEQLAERKENQRPLAQAIQEILLKSETSFEVRSQLELLLKKLPATALPVPPDNVTPEQIRQLVQQLDAGKYSERLGAAARLRWFITRPELACETMTLLKHVQADASLSPEARKQLQAIADAARQVWLTSDPKDWRLPVVSDGEIQGWLDDLTAEPPGEDASPAERKAVAARQEAAQQELYDLLARDDYLPRIKAALEQRLARIEMDDAARVRLETLFNLTRPAMVAEYWEEKHHLGIQHLLVGVPSQSAGARRPSHFDRIDDQTAHCVSGNSLSAGDYPVGVLFPHPEPIRANSQFHLVNLPTPRRRMAYEYFVKTDEATRLRELSERTLARILAERRPLSEAEFCMVQQLDEGAVSRFAGPYFMAVGDPIPPDREAEHRAGRASACVNLCQVLAEIGTREALEGLQTAIKEKRFNEPTPELPENWPWIAALAIAERHPDPKDDPWLASLIERTDPLRLEGDRPPELGATAAAILLMRHHVPLGRFGLESAEDRMLAESGAPGYRFVAAEMRQKVLRWWANQKPPVAQAAASVP